MNDYKVRNLPIQAMSAAAFAPFGTLIEPSEDGVQFGAGDSRLDLTQGTPRLYVMKIPGRGRTIDRITRHRRVTQALAAVGGLEWLLAVAPPRQIDVPDARPALADIVAFRVPGDVALMLHKGTWHAGPLFEGEARSFFNLELTDTNEVDHHTCILTDTYGTALRLV